ncbi:MAG: pacearchaeosortase [archaeon]
MKKRLSNLALRYLILIITALPNLWLFYFIFTPLTIYPVYFLLDLFFKATLLENTILISNQFSIQIISACVAGSAYYLLLILNLSTPDIKLNKRLKMLLIAFISLLAINILRIFLLSLMFIYGSSWFDITHKLFWYALSILFVMGIWFTEVKLFKIKAIPFYSDIKFLYKKIKN